MSAAPIVITSCGSFVASFEWKSTPSDETPASTKLQVPLPVIRVVTSYSTQVPVEIPALSSVPAPARVGRFAQVIPVSVEFVGLV